MSVTFGYTLFTVNDVASTLDFYTAAFGLQQRMITPEGDYGELETGSTTLGFVSSELAHNNLDAAGGFTELDAAQPPIAGSITLVTAEPASVAAKAIERGATEYVAPVDKPWGQTVAYVRDPNGVLVEIATPIGATAG